MHSLHETPRKSQLSIRGTSYAISPIAPRQSRRGETKAPEVVMNNTTGPNSEAYETQHPNPVLPTPKMPASATPPPPATPVPWGRWFRGFLATNPFYLL